MAKLTSEALWGAIDAIGKEEGADKIRPAAIAKLVQLKMVRLDRAGLPQLTAKGWRAYVVMESGDGEVPELDHAGR
jgi:hypothetical protein